MTQPENEVVPAILDGELCDEDTQAVTRKPNRTVRDWWTYSRLVPGALKSRQQCTRAVRDLLTRLVCSPVWLLRATGRGTVVSLRAWRQWIRVHDYRAAAEESEKLADKYTEIRELTLFRWKVTGAVVAFSGLVVLLGYVVYGWSPVWMIGAAGSVVLAITGRRKDGSPGRKAVLAGPRSLAWTMDPQHLVDAFRDAKLIGKDESLRLVERAHRLGEGWAITIDLPATRKAADVIKNREALASALAVDEVQLIAERVRGHGGHAGRVALWVADDDPYAVDPVRTPLVNAAQWDAWRPVPFGRDARDRRIDLPLVWTSLLIGAIPRQGKTFAARLAASGLVLDPFARLYVADFKAGKDWVAAGQVAHRFMSGDDLDHATALKDWLLELVGEVQGRYRRMRALDDQICPESKVTPAMSRDRSLNMPITALIIDEVQVPLEERATVAVQGKKVPLGEYIGELLTWLAKKAPAAGVVLILATQRPDSQTIPSSLRAVLGSRFALRVMDWRDSNIILGEQMNTRGYDSSRLLASHKGVGILRPDGDTDAGADVLAMTVRTYYMPNAEWQAICERGKELREQERTLTGQATGEEPTALLTETTAGLAESSQPRESIELPEPLASVATYVNEHGREREFIPTAELVGALEVDPTQFAGDMGELGCPPTRDRIPAEDGTLRRVRGYRVADIRSSVQQIISGGGSVGDAR